MMKQVSKKIAILGDNQWTLYAIGTFGYSLISTAFMMMHLYRYDPGVHNPYGWSVLASSALIGVAALLSRILNIFSSIIVGYLSDKTCSRWGRRRPFMALSLLPMIASFILIFTPPLPYTSVWNAVYLAVTLTSFFAFFSIYITPYTALLVEITHTTQQRLRLSTLVALSSLVGAAVALIAAPWIVGHLGFVSMAFLFGLIGFVCLAVPLAIKENSKVKSSNLPLWNSIRTVWQNPVFRSFTASQIPVLLTMEMIFLCSNYFVVALMQRSIVFGSIVNSAVLGGIVLGFVPVNLLAKYFGKKAILRSSLIWFSFSLLGLNAWSIWARNTLWLCLTLLVMCGMAIAAFLILPSAMTADIVDEDTKKTGVRREAIYFGIGSMVVVVSSGLATTLTGAILMFGKTPSRPLGVQLVYLTASLLALGGSWTLGSYPIKK